MESKKSNVRSYCNHCRCSWKIGSISFVSFKSQTTLNSLSLFAISTLILTSGIQLYWSMLLVLAERVGKSAERTIVILSGCTEEEFFKSHFDSVSDNLCHNALDKKE